MLIYWHIFDSFFLSICATSNIDLVVNILHKIYLMQRILIYIKANPVVEFGHLQPENAANLVTSSKYYHCHWIPLSNRFVILHRARLYFYATLQNDLTNKMDFPDERESARFGLKNRTIILYYNSPLIIIFCLLQSPCLVQVVAPLCSSS